MKQRIDKIWVGILVGMLGGFLGFLIFGYVFALINDISFSEFYQGVFLGVQSFQSKIVTVSMLVDIILFFIFIRKNYFNFCKGLMAVLVLAVLVVLWLY